MAINLDRMVHLHHSTVRVRTDQMEVISSNLANANTPGYKARAIDFNNAMSKALQGGQNIGGLKTTHSNHIPLSNNSAIGDAQFRVSDQPDTGDGNTVDVQRERNEFLDNGMRYQASLQFLDGKFKGMKKALSGGQ
ncbi:flagellar basal body rod protein FlgB [Opacimonas viscosa]|uniref:Flagellar basal body rod protein FlgB n=1 Tax=Opacimonas viscosa TaxID=2961944 RepID=A0AA41X396_9ALTE|nr:flagellar basal body rod protein FlgB [Opacimonas viscosa]MCP3427799.1 flagellar basal body rod protein FlgB [Opacimonas viscosa]